MNATKPRTVDALRAAGPEIDRAMRRGIRDALRMHKLLGNPVATVNDKGEVIWIPPEEIEIPDED